MTDINLSAELAECTINVQRLHHLIAILESVPEESFDLSLWRRESPCGTIACAVGWACADPLFNAQELTYRGGLPVYTDAYTGWEAVEAFFGLTRELAHWLFDVSYYESVLPTRSNVIKRVMEAVLKDHS